MSESLFATDSAPSDYPGDQFGLSPTMVARFILRWQGA